MSHFLIWTADRIWRIRTLRTLVRKVSPCTCSRLPPPPGTDWALFAFICLFKLLMLWYNVPVHMLCVVYAYFNIVDTSVALSYFHYGYDILACVCCCYYGMLQIKRHVFFLQEQQKCSIVSNDYEPLYYLSYTFWPRATWSFSALYFLLCS